MSLVYRRHPTNIGADRNYLAIVENASGTFCWLMGSDDAIAKGGLLRVLEASRNWRDHAGFSVNFATYDSDLRDPVESRKPVALDADTVIQGAGAIFTTFIGYWGYLAAHVVRRDLWNHVCATGEQHNFLNAYVHVYIMGRMAQEEPSWGYVAQKCVMWRSGNDSFLMGSNWLRRMRLDVVGYHQITDALFGESSMTGRRARDEIADRHILAQYRSAKARGRASLGEGAKIITQYYWKSPVYWKRLLPWIIAPSLILRPLFGIYLDRRAKRLKAKTVA
jgi:abequosyltransferase